MSKKGEKNVGTLIVLVVVAAAALLGFIVWRIWEAQPSQSSQPTSPRQGQQQPPEDTTDSSPSYVIIKEWGVRFQPHEDLAGLSYFKPAAATEDSFTFTTEDLATEVNCSQSSGNIVLGLLTRTTEPQPQFGSSVAEIDGYYYQFRGPQATCGSNNQAEALAVPKLSTSLRSLEAVE